MDYAKEYNLLLAENIKLQRKLRETSIKAVKYIELAQHERKLRLSADALNSKLNNTIKVMKHMNKQKDKKIEGLLETVYQQIQDDTILNLSSIKIDILV